MGAGQSTTGAAASCPQLTQLQTDFDATKQKIDLIYANNSMLTDKNDLTNLPKTSDITAMTSNLAKQSDIQDLNTKLDNMIKTNINTNITCPASWQVSIKDKSTICMQPPGVIYTIPNSGVQKFEGYMEHVPGEFPIPQPGVPCGARGGTMVSTNPNSNSPYDRLVWVDNITNKPCDPSALSPEEIQRRQLEQQLAQQKELQKLQQQVQQLQQISCPIGSKYNQNATTPMCTFNLKDYANLICPNGVNENTTQTPFLYTCK